MPCKHKSMHCSTRAHLQVGLQRAQHVALHDLKVLDRGVRLLERLGQARHARHGVVVLACGRKRGAGSSMFCQQQQGAGRVACAFTTAARTHPSVCRPRTRQSPCLPCCI